MNDALLTLALVIITLVLLDITAIRFGATSRRSDDDRPDWW